MPEKKLLLFVFKYIEIHNLRRARQCLLYHNLMLTGKLFRFFSITFWGAYFLNKNLTTKHLKQQILDVGGVKPNNQN